MDRVSSLNAAEPLWGDSLPKEFEETIWSISAEQKVELTLESPSGFEPGTSELSIQCPNN